MTLINTLNNSDSKYLINEIKNLKRKSSHSVKFSINHN